MTVTLRVSVKWYNKSAKNYLINDNLNLNKIQRNFLFFVTYFVFTSCLLDSGPQQVNNQSQ